ncbi:uncharacterized protein J8A68_004665 [[Candida] subhashii]|uniref:Siderophore iron transporter 1 n=1 Tax=[Candida] subhashii TaxID=561895 RepID=A0A8J5QGL7_9ASCO|nr:uncharacterized protein J8A68_004665 [[Candida] subhashii]KAG7661809.1 hypothetical protein J8A68_004665 [[Candida] subhashii]
MNSNSEANSKEESVSDHDQSFQQPPQEVVHTTTKSIGIRRAELLNSQYSCIFSKVCFFISIFFVAYTYSIDGTIRGNLQYYATSSYSQHSLFTTVKVIQSVISAAAQPTYARLSDRFGRLELTVVSIVFYAVGTVIESQAYDINRFAGGAVLYQAGYSGIIIMLQIVLADFSDLNWRLAASFVPALPFIINAWAGGNMMEQFLAHHSWQWGIGMWAFIFPLSCVPLLICLVHMIVKARKTPEWKDLNEEAKANAGHSKLSIKYWTKLSVELFWELDIAGILFIIVILGFILVPFTIAGGIKSTWAKGSTIAPLVIGFVLIPAFIVWEAKFSRFPVMPLALMKDRGVWSAMFIAILIDWIWYMPNDFMYTVLIVGMNASVKAATRITYLYSFVSVIVGPLLGLLVTRVRRLKGFIIFGCACWSISLGILLHFRGDNNGVESQKYLNGVIGGLCLMGFGAGFFTYSTQVSISTVTNHEYMSVIISLYLASYNVGAAIGASVSGAIWTNKMPSVILGKMEQMGVSNATALATEAYGDPFGFIIDNVWGSTPRMAVVLSYAEVQRYLCIAGLVLCFPLLTFTFFLRDHRLDSVQSLGMQTADEEKGKEDEVVVNNYDDDIILTKLKNMFKIPRN